MSTKQCTKCGAVRPLASFCKDAQKKDGLHSHCNDCQLAASRARRGVTTDRQRARMGEPRKTKVEITRDWRLRNPEGYRASITRRKPENLKAAHKRWRDKNIERERRRVSAYRREFPEVSAKSGVLRRAAERLACPAWADRAEMADWYRLAEVMSRGGVKFTIDHMVPIRGKTVCGLHAPANFQLMTGLENSSKSNRYWPEMWA